MKELRFPLGALAALLFFVYRPLFALDDWLPINREELAMKADPNHPADAIVLYHEEVSDDNTQHFHFYERVKVLTEKGRKYADVRLRYDEKNGGIVDVKARTIAPDGTIIPFTDKVFDTTIVKGRGLKYRAKAFTLPNVQPGSIIEWKYTYYWNTHVYAPHWTVDEDLFQKRAKFAFIPFLKSGRYVTNAREQILDRVYYSFVGLPENTAIKNVGQNRMELELNDIPPFEEEPFSPPAEVLRKRVNFYYGTDKMEKPVQFWKEEGKYWSKEVDRFIGHSSAVAAAATQAVTPSDTAEQKVRKIYAQVQKMKNLTYVSKEDALVERARERTENERRTIEDVLQKGEGYRDELARLFTGLVRALNIPAYVMRVSDRDEYFFQQNVPNPRQLTSEIAIVTLDGKDIFLDPGTPYCPFQHLKWQHTLTKGIRQTAGGTELGDTQPISYKDAISKRVGRLALSADGSVRGKVAIVWTGEEALDHRLNGLKTDEAGRKKDLENELREMLPSGATVHFESATAWDDPDKQLTATFNVEIPAYAATAGKRTLVPTALFETNARQPFAHGERKHPIYFTYPFYNMDDVQIAVPQNLRVEDLPQTQPVKADFALYQTKRSVNGNVLAFNRDFAMGSIGFRPDEYDQVKKFFAGVSSGDSEQAILTSAPQ